MHSEKRTAAKEKRHKRAAPAKASAAGGEWGEQFRRRLRQLVKTHAASNAAFARECGIQAPRLCEWLAGEQVPSAESLRALAQAFSVSLDWLLEGLDHQGEQSAEPVYRGQWRDMPTLEADLAAKVAQCMEPAHRALVGVGLIDSAAVIAAVKAEAAEYARAVLEWVHNEATRSWLQNAMFVMTPAPRPGDADHFGVELSRHDRTAVEASFNVFMSGHSNHYVRDLRRGATLPLALVEMVAARILDLQDTPYSSPAGTLAPPSCWHEEPFDVKERMAVKATYARATRVEAE